MIVIIGAGISGLTLAYELQRQNKEYMLLEAGDRAGGYIQTDYKQKTLLELGPGSILADQEIVDFLEQLGLKEQIVYPESTGKIRYVYKDGKIQKMPDTPGSFFKSKFFSWNTKAAVIGELFNKRKPIRLEESVGEFFERRFNKEIVDYAVTPFVSGIYAGDPYRLLINKTFPFLKNFEGEHGSVLKGFIKSVKQKKKAPKKPLYFQGGMKTLPEKIAGKLDNIYYNSRVTGIREKDSGFLVEYLSHNSFREVKADKIVLAVPAFVAGELLQQLHPFTAGGFRKINYPSIVKIFFTFKKADVGVPLNGYGVLYPKVENKPLLGTLWNSSVYPVSSSEDEILITSIAGGMLNPEYLQKSDDEIMDEVLALIKETYQIKGGPVVSEVSRLKKAIPQYDKEIGNAELLAQNLEEENIFVCANWRRGPSLTDCIKKGIELAKRL